MNRPRNTSTPSRIIDAAFSKPEGLLVMATGLALLMRNSGASPAVRDIGSEVRTRVQEYAGQMSDAAGFYLETMQGARSQVTETLASAPNSLRNTVSSLSDQPVILALLAAAAGVGAATLMPRTQFEDAALETVRGGLGELAKDLTGKAVDAASQATDTLKDEAAARGLMPEQLRETAGEIAQKVIGSMGDAAKIDVGQPEADKPSASSTLPLPSGDTDLDRAIKAH